MIPILFLDNKTPLGIDLEPKDLLHRKFFQLDMVHKIPAEPCFDNTQLDMVLVQKSRVDSKILLSKDFRCQTQHRYYSNNLFGKLDRAKAAQDSHKPFQLSKVGNPPKILLFYSG